MCILHVSSSFSVSGANPDVSIWKRASATSAIRPSSPWRASRGRDEAALRARAESDVRIDVDEFIVIFGDRGDGLTPLPNAGALTARIAEPAAGKTTHAIVRGGSGLSRFATGIAAVTPFYEDIVSGTN